MWKIMILCLSFWEYSSAGPLGIKKNMPIVQDNDSDSTLRGSTIIANEEKPASEMIISKLNLPSNATSIRADITDGFSCDNKTYGYYADVDNECQIFHVCLPVVYADGKENTFRWSFICPEETVFSQDSFTCMRAEDMNINCDESYMYYDLNRNFGMVEETMDTEMSGENDEEIKIENSSKQSETIAEDRPIPIKTPVKPQMNNPNRKKNQSQRRKPTQPIRKVATSSTTQEILIEPEFQSTTVKIISTYPKFTKRPPTTTTANVPTQKKDQRPDIYNPKRKRPQHVQQQILRDASADKIISEKKPTPQPTLYPNVQMQPEPEPTLKIETFFKPATSYHTTTLNTNEEKSESEKSSDFGYEEDDESQASEIKEVSVKPALSENTENNYKEAIPPTGTASVVETKKEPTLIAEASVNVSDGLKIEEPVIVPFSDQTTISNTEEAIQEINPIPLANTEVEKKIELQTPLIPDSEVPAVPADIMIATNPAIQSIDLMEITPQSIRLSDEISLPEQSSINLSETDPVLEEIEPEIVELAKEEENTSHKESEPLFQDNVMSNQHQLEQSPPSVNELNSDPSQMEADSAQALIADFISTLVNAESAKLEEKPSGAFESPMELAQTEEIINKEIFPQLTESITVNKETEPAPVLASAPAPFGLFQIPVQVIHSLPYEQSTAAPVSATTSAADEKNPPKSSTEDEQKNEGGVFIPLSIDDVVELVKDRLDEKQPSAVQNETPIQIPSHPIMDEPLSSEILPIYTRLPDIQSNVMLSTEEPKLVAIVHQDAPSINTINKDHETENEKPSEVVVEKQIDDKPSQMINKNEFANEKLPTNRTDVENIDSAAKQRVVIRRNVKIHKIKMDPRKRRFLFRSHAS